MKIFTSLFLTDSESQCPHSSVAWSCTLPPVCSQLKKSLPQTNAAVSSSQSIAESTDSHTRADQPFPPVPSLEVRRSDCWCPQFSSSRFLAKANTLPFCQSLQGCCWSRCISYLRWLSVQLRSLHWDWWSIPAAFPVFWLLFGGQCRSTRLEWSH